MIKLADYYSRIKESFNASASNYNKNAVLQHEVGKRLVEQLEYFTLNPNIVLDLGMGTGHVTYQLAEKYPNSFFIGLDFSEAMLKIAKNNDHAFSKLNPICADINKLPIDNNSVDLIFSNFTLQWADNLPKLFKECYRILKNDGLFIFALPGPDTLYELREAFQTVDPDYDHVNNFIDMHNIGDMLVHNNFAHPVIDNDHFTLTYRNVISILKDLKSIGANVKLSHNYRRSLFGKSKFQALHNAYEKFKQSDNKYPLTYEVIYAHAFKLAKPVRAKHPEISGVGEVFIPVDKIIK